jgi:hypothetical protein
VRVEVLDQAFIVTRRGFESEPVNAPIVCGAYQLYPAAFRHLTSRGIRDEFPQMLPAIAFPKLFRNRLVCSFGHVLGSRYGIEIWQKGNGNPVKPGDAAISAEYGPGLARTADAKERWGFGTNTRKINRGMSQWTKGAEFAVRFADKECDSR